MLKSFSICAALILAAAAFSTSAEAQHRGVGGGARMGGAHFSGARVGSFGGARMGNIAGPGRMGAYGGRAIYSGGRYAGGRAIYSGGRYAGGRAYSGAICWYQRWQICLWLWTRLWLSSLWRLLALVGRRRRPRIGRRVAVLRRLRLQ